MLRLLPLFALLLAAPAVAQDKDDEKKYKFREDPYTEEEGAWEAAGYFGKDKFDWGDDHSTVDIDNALGGAQVVWLETEHFKIGVSLEEYTIDVNSKEEKAKIRAELKSLGLEDKTVIVFTSDNGGLLGPTHNAPLRSGKGNPYEGGVRVPLKSMRKRMWSISAHARSPRSPKTRTTPEKPATAMAISAHNERASKGSTRAAFYVGRYVNPRGRRFGFYTFEDLPRTSSIIGCFVWSARVKAPHDLLSVSTTSRRTQEPDCSHAASRKRKRTAPSNGRATRAPGGKYGQVEPKVEGSLLVGMRWFWLKAIETYGSRTRCVRTAPSGTRPTSTNRQRAIRSFLASATIPIFRSRLLPPPNRSRYQ